MPFLLHAADLSAISWALPDFRCSDPAIRLAEP